MNLISQLSWSRLINSIKNDTDQWHINNNTLKNNELNINIWVANSFDLVAYMVDGKLYFTYSEKQCKHVINAIELAFPNSQPHFKNNEKPAKIVRTKSQTRFLQETTATEATPKTITQKNTPTILKSTSGLRIVKKANGSKVIRQTTPDVNVLGFVPFNYKPNFSSEILNTICLKVYNLFNFGSFTRPSFLPAVV